MRRPTKEEYHDRSSKQIEELLDGHRGHIPEDRLIRIVREFHRGYEFLKDYSKTVSIFGSARHGEDHPHYQEARRLAVLLSEQGYTIITGGGPGIMEAANRGAQEAGGESVGLNIQLAHEQDVNDYVDRGLSFYYFFVRKVMLSFAARVYVFFPGGYGTLDELFEMLTLIQTEKAPHIPMVLVGKEYWRPLVTWMEEVLCREQGTISKADTGIYHLVDSAEEAVAYILENDTE